MTDAAFSRRSSPPLRRGDALVAAALVAAALAWGAASRGNDRTGIDESAAGTLAVGSPAPAVRLSSTDGTTVDLSHYRGKRHVLLYFYEGAGFAPCESQLVELQEASDRFESQGIAVVALSVQDVETSQELAERLGLTVPILADTGATVARSFGIYDAPGTMGPFSTRSFWLIDKKGTITYRAVSLEMNVAFDELEAAVAPLPH